MLDPADLVVKEPEFPASSRDELCGECVRGRRDVGDVKPEDLVMRSIALHALRYSCPGGEGGAGGGVGEGWAGGGGENGKEPPPLWSFTADRPAWAIVGAGEWDVGVDVDDVDVHGDGDQDGDRGGDERREGKEEEDEEGVNRGAGEREPVGETSETKG